MAIMDKLEKINHLIDTLDHYWYLVDTGDNWYYLKCDELGTIIFSLKPVVDIEDDHFVFDYDYEPATLGMVKERRINQKIVENVCNKLNSILKN